MAATVRSIPNPKVGVPHGLAINLDGDSIIGYNWQVATTLGGGGANPGGLPRTSATYTPVESDVGKFLFCEVEFTSAGSLVSRANDTCSPEDVVRKHSAAAPGPRFVVRNHNTPRVKTSYEAMRESGNP
jgi:hypothetical protein